MIQISAVPKADKGIIIALTICTAAYKRPERLFPHIWLVPPVFRSLDWNMRPLCAHKDGCLYAGGIKSVVIDQYRSY